MTFDSLKLIAAGCVLLISGLEAIGGEETTIKATSPAKEGFRLSIFLSNKEFDVGSPISVSVVTTNVSKIELRNEELNKWYTYDVVLIKDHKKPELTKLGKQMFDPFSNMCIMQRTLARHTVHKYKPGEKRIDLMIINQVYDMTEPGIYSLQFERLAPAIGKEYWVILKTDPIDIVIRKPKTVTSKSSNAKLRRQ